MYAIIKTGGKQYRVTKGQILDVESITGIEGSEKTLQFEKVMMIVKGDEENDLQIGSPYIKNAYVTAEVLAHKRAKKIEILKFKRRKHHMKRQGHRQNYMQVKITEIQAQ